MRVLVIDDVYIARHIIKVALEQQNIFVEEASSAKNALGIMNNFEFDCVLLDLGLPDMNGLELLKKIKELDNNIRVIVITGYCDKQILRECILLGCEHYLLKPVNTESLLEILIKSA